MKSIQLITAFLMLSCNVLFASSVQVNWGGEIKTPKKTSVNKIIGEDAEHFYVIRSQSSFRKTKIFLEKYASKNMNLIFSKELKMPNTKGQEVKYEEMFLVDGKILLFTSYFNKDQSKNYAFVNTISKEGVVNNDMKELDFIVVEKKRNRGNFDFVLSNDSTKILVYHNEPFEKYKNEKFSYKVINNSLDVVWSKNIELPYKDKYFNISDYMVDNDGNVYMLAKVTSEDMKRSKKEQPNYKYSILSYLHKTDETREYDVNLGKLFIDDLTFRIDPSGNLVTAGYFANTISSGMSGVFYLRIDKNTKEVVAKGIKEFDKAFLAEFMTSRQAEKGNKGLDFRFVLDDLVTRTDGGAILVSEYYYMKEVCTTDPKTGARTCRYYYYYNDILVVSIKPDGNIDWTRRIPKKQVSGDGGYYSSYIKAVVGDKIHFIFNDNPKNMQLKDPKKLSYMNSPKKAIVTMVTLDGSEQKATRVPMFNVKDQKIITRPKIHLQTKSNEVIIFGIKGSVYKFGRIKFG